jgi:hypothetical protein
MYIHTYTCHSATAPSRPGPPHYRGFTITHRHTTLGRIPLDEWSAWRRDLYLTTLNNHKTQTPKPPAVFEPIIPASKRTQSHALDRVATGIGCITWSATFAYTRETVEKQTPTHWNLIDRSTTAPPPLLSPSSILPPLSHCAFIPVSRNRGARFKNIISIFCPFF